MNIIELLSSDDEAPSPTRDSDPILVIDSDDEENQPLQRSGGCGTRPTSLRL